jgi:serine/threonine-protein kinase
MPAAEHPPGTLVAGKYELRGLLGAGGVGAVYAATNIAIGRRVAIKFLGPELANREDLKARFDMEARASAAIDHPGIVDVLDQGETATGDPFIVMEHLQGATLRSVLKAVGVFSVGQVVAVMAPVLDALAAAHRANIIHRDIKPANIFVCARPAFVVKVLDFGISWFGESSGLTLEGTAVGTPRYMAPEQVLGEELGPETDLYAVGASIYHLVCGKPPFEGMSDMATLARLLTSPPQSLRALRPELPPAFADFVERLMSRDRHARPRDATAAAAELRGLANAEVEAIYAAALAAADDEAKLTPLPSPSAPGARRGPSSGTNRRPSVASADRTATLASPPSQAPAPLSLAPLPPPATARRVPPPVLGVGVVGLLAALAFAGWSVSRPAADPVPVAAPRVDSPAPAPVESPKAVVAPTAAPEVSVTVQLDPSSARLSGDDLAECNPCVLTRPQGAKLTLKATAPGYTTTDVVLGFDQPRTERVVLAPTRPTSPAKQPGKKKAGPLNVQEKNPYE